MSDAEVVENGPASRFEVRVDGEPAGFAAYRRNGSTITFTHTEIDERFEGRGLGSVLVRGALDAARAEGAAVLPSCPFVRRYISRHQEYLDLVPASQRARFELPAGSPAGAGSRVASPRPDDQHQENQDGEVGR